MINRAELARWAAVFEVTTEQVRRDHLISHVLAAVADDAEAETVFYGGTALCRSFLDNTRLSEDVDLLHPRPPERIAALANVVPRALRREFPDLEWSTDTGSGTRATARISARGLTPIRLDIRGLGADHRAWKFVPTNISLRYTDLPEVAALECPTLATFAAMKLLAWYDRHAPRDLFDLAGLADLGALTEEAVELLRAAVGYGFLEVEFRTLPGATLAAWDAELGAQVGELPTAQSCAARVIRGLEAAPG
jgi:predicted nucleotidyltransferase component of viral defense system